MVVVRMSLMNSGDLVKVDVEHSSGSRALDTGALEAVRSSAPFGPFPKTITNSRLDIIANFVYQSGYRPIYSQ
jgi:TonB family protein